MGGRRRMDGSVEIEWPAPVNVQAVMSTREGGASQAPFDSFNLGDHVGDDAQAVAANRARLAQNIAAKPVFLNQLHGWDAVALDVLTPQGTQADACFTTQPQLACTIMVADCLPVLFCNRQGTVVGAAHAGWRGLLGQTTPEGPQGVLEQIYGSLANISRVLCGKFASKTIASEWLVWLGPCIGPAQFEVGADVQQAFVSSNPASAVHFQAQANALSKESGKGKWLADLQGLARQRLAALGFTEIYGNDGSSPWCTVGNPSRFFSHRRDHARLGGSGRMVACIWLDSCISKGADLEGRGL